MEEKKTQITNMVNDIYEQCVVDYLYVIVKDAYSESCFERDSQRSAAASDLTA